MAPIMNPVKRGLSVHTPAVYRIELQGVLESHWSADLAGMEVRCTNREGEPPVTTLTGELVDQTALAGVLDLVYNLGLPLISVECLSPKS